MHDTETGRGMLKSSIVASLRPCAYAWLRMHTYTAVSDMQKGKTSTKVRGQWWVEERRAGAVVFVCRFM